MDWPEFNTYKIRFSDDGEFDKAREKCKGTITDIGWLDRVLVFSDKGVRDGWADLLEKDGMTSFRVTD